MWLAFKKFILALLLPIAGFFSFSPQAQPPATLPAAEIRVPPAGAIATVPQPVMRPPAKVDTLRQTGADLPMAVIKECLTQSSRSGECLDGIFQKFLESHSAAEALAMIERHGASDTGLRLSCHPVVHAVGRETFRLKGTVQDSFAECDQTCHSGCYHGAMERFLRGTKAGDDEAGHISLEELRSKAAAACDPSQPTRFRFQCLHGLGHALLFFSDYRLVEALSSCDVLLDAWSQSSCYGGLFMENVFSATPAKRDLSASDFHYPCSKLDAKYKNDCYMMQTTRMTEMGLLVERLFEECRKARSYQYTCMQSIGRDLSNDARVGDPRLVAAKCELGQGPEREACTRGTAYALLDNTWDGRYALPFCASFKSDTDASYCFTISISYLKSTFAKSGDEVLADCLKYVPAAPICREVIDS